jgi:16S rRNA (adenine1518-N6/adenine1519-N6)-dimethyltransferase
MLPLHVPTLLRQYGLRPRKSLGQNFLVDEHWLERVAEAAHIHSEDTVLEIGAGLGSLTRHLAIRAGRVQAVEIDKSLLPILREVTAPFANVRVIEGDILALPIETLLGNIPASTYRVAANIPYYITSAVIRQLLESSLRPVCLLLTVQQEVAQRICAAPGDMSLLAVSVQYYGDPIVVGTIPAAAFFPAPNVESAIIRIDIRQNIEGEVSPLLFRLAKAGFSQKRKMLRNTIAAGLHLDAKEVGLRLQGAGIDPRRRAETLAVEEWIRLSRLDWGS